MEAQEFSLSGDPVYRYEGTPKKEFTLAIGDVETIEAVSNHVEKYIGKIDIVFHEIISDLVHLDVNWVKPTKRFPFHSLVTSGMSNLPMNVPKGWEEHKHAELCILLPPDWPIVTEDYTLLTDVFKGEQNYWPVFWLKYIARMPHEYDNWVGHGHTIPNWEEAEPYADNTKLCAVILLKSISLGTDFFELEINESKTIKFYCLYPIYREEMEFKLKNGAAALIEKFEKYRISDVVNIKRKNACEKKGIFGF